MDRIHLHKRGIVKTNKVKEHRKFKKTMRQFTQDGPNENNPISGSELIFGEKKKKTYDGDVTNKLLALISGTATVTNVHAAKLTSTNYDKICDTSQCERKNCFFQKKHILSSTSKKIKRPEIIDETHIVNGTGSSFESKTINGNGISPKSIEHLVTCVSEGKKTKKNIFKNQELNTQAVKDGQHTYDLQKINEQHNKHVKKSNGKGSSSSLQELLVEEKYSSESRVHENDCIGSRKSLKGMKGGENNQIKKSKKHNLSGCLSLGGRHDSVEETGNAMNTKTIQNSETHIVSSVLVESKHLSNKFRVSEMKHKSDRQNSPVKHSKNKSSIDKQLSSVKKIEDGLSQTPERNNQFEKESKERASSDAVLAKDWQESNISGEWSVINSDKHTKFPSSQKNSKNSTKRKRKSSVVPEPPSDNSSNSYCEQQQEKQETNLGDVKENNPDRVKGYNHSLIITEKIVKVSKKHCRLSPEKSKPEFSKLSPILVEMSGSDDLPSNPFCSQFSDMKAQHTALTFNLKSDLSWKPSSNICSTGKWQVHYGNTEHSLTLEDKDVEPVEVRCEQIESKGMEMTIPESKELSPLKNVADNEYPQSVIEDNSFGSYQLFDISKREVILALPPSSQVFFNGALKVKVLLGKMSVLGYELSDTSSKVYTVYSPYGVSFLCLQASNESGLFESEEKYWELVQQSTIHVSQIQERIMHKIPEFSTLILLKSVSETLISFLHKFYPSLHFPSSKTPSSRGKKSCATLRTLFINPRERTLYRQSSKWSDLSSSFLKHTPDEMRVLVCGGKGVGKSTFLRFLVNQNLSKFKEVLYLDFDPGQSEFSVPGCISVVKVKDPLLGPNFTHLTNPERMVYLGEVDVSRCSHRYLSSVQYIFNWCCSQPQFKNLPWLINTMGFVRGIGVELLVEIIRLVKPSDVVQINSGGKKRNLPFLMNVEHVQNHVSSLHSCASTDERPHNRFQFHLLSSMAETPTAQTHPWGIQANVLRETLLLSYLSQMVVPPAYSLLEVVPHKLPFSRLKLCICHEKPNFSNYVSAMNGNLVALCKAEKVVSLKPSDPEYPEILEDTPVCRCFGFGIVRGVDLEKKMFFIITPVETRNVEFVNCLVLGSVNLPQNVYTSQDEAHGQIPYVVEGTLLPLAWGVREAKSVLNKKK